MKLLKALTFIARFRTAQFKVHFQKLARRSYLIPPPSAVAGLFGAIMGVPRDKLKAFCEEQRILTGAELRNLEGYYVTVSRIFKFDRDKADVISLLEKWSRNPRDAETYKAIVGLMPLKESEELFKPEYKFAIAGKDEVIEECLRRVQELNFEHDIFGGNDYHFVEYIGGAREASLTKSKKGCGYCLAEDVQQIDAQEYNVVFDSERLVKGGVARLPVVVFAPVGPKARTFLFVYGASIVAKSNRDAVQDGESTIFVFDPSECLVSWPA